MIVFYCKSRIFFVDSNFILKNNTCYENFSVKMICTGIKDQLLQTLPRYKFVMSL